MVKTGGAWQVIPDASDEGAYAALKNDRIWNAFAIGDLEPPFREYSRIAIAQRPGSAPSATCLLLESPAFNVMAPQGDPEGVAAILRAVDLPVRTGIFIRSEHVTPVSNHFEIVSERQQMVRMAVDGSTFQPVARASGLVALSFSDLDDLLELYAGYPENHFARIQLEQGVFFGVREEGRLVATGGTHVVCARYGIAVLGGIYTDPAARGRGYASAVTSALIAKLFDMGCQDVVLNVYANNHTARRVYERLGFHDHCPYEAVEGLLRAMTK